MKSFRLLISLMLATMTAGVAASAHAANVNVRVHGASCWSTNPNVNFNQFGIYNLGASPATIYCPMPIMGQPPAFDMSMVAYDRSTTSNVVCTITASSPDGVTATFGTIQTSDSAGFGAQTASSGATFLGAPPNAYFALSCVLPAVAGPGASILTSFRLGWN